jgi:hypothetical protein
VKEIQNLNFNGYFEETKEVFEYLGGFRHGFIRMPGRAKSVTLKENWKRWIQTRTHTGLRVS